VARFAEGIQLTSLCCFVVAGFMVSVIVGLLVAGVGLCLVGLALDPRVRGRS
jgi:hypothetical protein